MVFLGLVLLPLEEVEFALPKSFLLIKLRLELSMLLLHIIILGFPVLHLLSYAKLPLRQGLIELLILLLEFLVLDFVCLNKIFLLSLQVFVFFNLDSLFSLKLRVGLLDILFKLLECLSLLFILDLDALLLLLNSSGSLLHCL